MRKGNNDLEKESNYLSIVVVLALFLICSLGYIAYDKFFLHIADSEKEAKQSSVEKPEVVVELNKDGYFVQNLINDIYYQSGVDHNEFQLFVNEKTTADDLTEYYRNSLIVRKLRKMSFTTEELDKTTYELFGKKVFDSYPDKIVGACSTYEMTTNGSMYTENNNAGGCGGSGYRYYDKITSVDTDENHIYIYQKVGFQCSEGICKTPIRDNNHDTYTAKDPIVELEDPMDSVDLDSMINDLNEYKYTYQYDTKNNIYYFVSVELVK